MARRVMDLQYAPFRRFTRTVQIAKRELRELAPETTGRAGLLIRRPEERKVVMAYILARKCDEKTGDGAHVAAFMRDRQAARLLRAIMARIPTMPDVDA